MNNNVRLGVEAVLVIVLIIALFLYFSQQQQLSDANLALENANATVTALEEAAVAQASELEAAEQAAADAEAAVEEQTNMAATAMADAEAAAAQVEEAQAAADAAASAQADAEADAEEQANMAATAMADADAAAAQVEEAQAAAEAAAQQAADLQATIDAMNAATPEPDTEATEEAATEEASMDVVGFSNDAFSMALDASYTTYSVTGDDREASLAAIADVDAELENRLNLESTHEYAAVQGEGEYVLVNQQGLPDGVTSVNDVLEVAFRRATGGEVVTLGDVEAARGMFGDNEVRYIVLDAGSMWVITFVSDAVEDNMGAFDDAVGSFDAVEPPEEESSE